LVTVSITINTLKGGFMATKSATIDPVTLASLVEAGAVRGADVIGHAGGWGVVVRYGTTERALAARRGAMRTFRKFETLVTYLKGIGISQYHVNAAEFDVASFKTTRVRPDSSLRMRSAFEAKAHADWMQDRATDSLADPAPNFIHEKVMADAQAVIDAKRKKHAGKAAS
jgi:hypothetical protein